jgi:hypothetical protein
MKLAIIVIYLFDETSEVLLDIHLNSFRKFTKSNYTIYAAVNRLSKEQKEKLKKYGEVKQCAIPTTDLRGGEEHAYYLDHLAKIAIQDGSTHIAALHLDSFPVRSNWDRTLKALTDQTSTCVVLEEAYTACLFFPKEFYLSHQPTFATIQNDPSYLEFLKEYSLVNHSGTPFMFKSFTNKRPWHVLYESSSHNFGKIYGGLIFHLGGAIRFSSKSLPKDQSFLNKNFTARIKRWLIMKIIQFKKRPFVHKLWVFLRRNMPKKIAHVGKGWAGRNEVFINYLNMESEKNELKKRIQTKK